MDLNEAIYKIRSKEKMIKANFRRGTGNSPEYLQELIDEALVTTKAEFAAQVKQGSFEKNEAKNIIEALFSIAKISYDGQGSAVVTYPEFSANELHINSVGINLDDSFRQASQKGKTN